MKRKIFHKKNISRLLALAILCFLYITLFLPSCIEEPTLSKRDIRNRVDTLYKYEVADLNKILDSICEAQTDSMIQFNVDSIMKIRLEQIEKLIQN